MRADRISLTRAASELFDRNTPYDEVRAESILDDLWDEGIVICLGEFFLYDYNLTVKGHEYLKEFLGIN